MVPVGPALVALAVAEPVVLRVPLVLLTVAAAAVAELVQAVALVAAE